MTRREFIGTAASAAAGTICAPAWAGAKKPFIWAGLYHLGLNMWSEAKGADHLRFDENEWRMITARMQEVGMNMVVIDLGEGVVYPSHPEIAVKGSWSVEKLRKELARLRAMGLEPIPKMNFSAAHDLWLGEYGRMLSTRKYYQVCADLIRDVKEIFDTPRFFHLGFDEEGYDVQAANGYKYIAIRRGDLFWHDLLWFIRGVEKLGMRAWTWGDRFSTTPDEFCKNMPKSVVQSYWYYDDKFGPFPADYKDYQKKRLEGFVALAKAGYDTIHSGSTCKYDVGNMRSLARWCFDHVPEERMLGLVTVPWQTTQPEHRAKNLGAVEDMGQAIADRKGVPFVRRDGLTPANCYRPADKIVGE